MNWSGPLVSVITPTYNCEDFIADTIASVQAQDFDDWEHIIVDDGSSDRTIEIVNSYISADPRIKLIVLNENGGAAVARNAGLAAARGRFMAFLDADDLWLPTKLSVQIGYMLENEAPFTYARYEIISEDGHVQSSVTVPATTSYHRLLMDNVIGCLTAVYDTEYFGDQRMPLIRKRQELGLWLRLLKKLDHAQGIPVVLAQYRIRPGSLSFKKSNAARYTWVLYRHVEGLPLPVAGFFFSIYAFNGVFKKYFGRRREKVTPRNT